MRLFFWKYEDFHQELPYLMLIHHPKTLKENPGSTYADIDVAYAGFLAWCVDHLPPGDWGETARRQIGLRSETLVCVMRLRWE